MLLQAQFIKECQDDLLDCCHGVSCLVELVLEYFWITCLDLPSFLDYLVLCFLVFDLLLCIFPGFVSFPCLSFDIFLVLFVLLSLSSLNTYLSFTLLSPRLLSVYTAHTYTHIHPAL